MGEKFAANPVTGTATMTVPIATSPGRTGFGPSLSLTYDSGSGNGPFGFGWSLSEASITRKTNRGIPRYMDDVESDVFLLVGAEDLVPVLNGDGSRFETRELAPGYVVHRYRPRTEGGTSGRLERWTSLVDHFDVHWRHLSAENVLTRYGVSEKERIYDPLDKRKIFSWLISDMSDCKGNSMVYTYKPEDGSRVDSSKPHQRNRGDSLDVRRTSNRYLKSILYGNKRPLLDGQGQRPMFLSKELVDSAQWMFEAVFDYGEHNDDVPTPRQDKSWGYRLDAFSTYRAGFEVRTTRLCRRVLMFHHFPDETDVGGDCLVRTTEFTYSNPGVEPAVYTFLTSVQQTGYRRKSDGYVKRSVPPLEFEYTEPRIVDKLELVDESALENLPAGFATNGAQFIDLYSEGIPGVMVAGSGGTAWYYKGNESPLNEVLEDGIRVTKPMFGPLTTVLTKPNNLDGQQPRFADLTGDGILSVLDEEGGLSGFYRSNGELGWEDFKPFSHRANLSLKDEDVKMVDLTGDGFTDILVEDEGKWYESIGELGFRLPRDVQYRLDEEDGPINVFSDTQGGVYLADLSGDGLTDIVRIRNGEVCYWPSLGYGSFGAKVTMDKSPWFCEREDFDAKKVVLADVDGSGTTDIIYLHREALHCYFNESGNGWSSATVLDAFPPPADGITSVQAIDILGNGTSCLVFSTPLPPSGSPKVFYIPLMGSQKPHLLTKVTNNMGATTTLAYAPSTKFYLQDKRAGNPWVSKLPFPVQCLESVLVYDHISRNRLGSVYSYHHGFYDGFEREFRGFGLVEQWDREDIFAVSGHDPTTSGNFEGVKTPAVHTKTWFHQGMWFTGETISLHFEKEYFRPPKPSDTNALAWFLPDTVMPDGLTVEEERDACRALKGKVLRQEIYSESPAGAAKEVIERDKVPFTVSESNFTLLRLQPRVVSAETHIQSSPGVFMASARETISHTFERNVASDPRIKHSMVLETNNVGQILRQVDISYGRASPDIGLPTDWDRDVQGRTVVTYSSHKTTNAVDDITKWPFMYRVPMEAESSSWEITGLSRGDRSKPFEFEDFHQNDFSVIESASIILFEKDADPTKVQKRMYRCTRTLFRSDSLTSTLPLEHLEPLSIAANNYELAFTASMLDQYLQRNNAPLLPAPAALLTGNGANDGGYVRSADLKLSNLFPTTDADDDYWAPSGESYFSLSSDPDTELQDARKHFYLPVRFRSPFGVESKMKFDDYDLLVLDTEDFVGNRRTVGRRDTNGNILANGNDYRVLQPRLVTDMNFNRGEVVFDALGGVSATAVKGKETEGLSDDLTGIDPDLPEGLLLGHLSNPTVDPHSILLGATSRTLYDHFAYLRTRNDPQPQPAVTYSLTRMTHQADLRGEEKTEVHHSFSYTDGFGRLIQKKHQSNSGPVSKRDRAGKIVLDTDKQPILTDTSSDPRWISSGWVVYNNKGLVVMQFEPFFTHLHTFEFDARVGTSFVNFYDALGRTTITLHPDGTYVKNTFDNWSSALWDPNDTVALDPRTDPDVREYVGDCFDGGFVQQGFQTWLQRRQEPGTAPEELDAAQKALAHQDTPALTYVDSLGRPFLTAAHRKVAAADHPQDKVNVTQYTRGVMDIEGQTRAVRDASVQNGDQLGRVVERMDYDMLGRVMRKECMEKGFTWTVHNIFGQAMFAWNERGLTVRSRFDGASRLISTSVLGDPLAPDGPETEIQISRVVFGESHPDAEGKNLRGRAWMDLDQSGAVTVEKFDFKGNVVESTRRFCKEYKKTVDWKTVDGVLPVDIRAHIDIPALEASLATELEMEIFTDQSTFDAMNRMVTGTFAHTANMRASTIRMGYDVVSLTKIECNLQDERENGQKKWTGFVDGIQYTADGRRIGIQYTSGITTTYSYDIEHNLRRQLTTRGNGAAADNLQDLKYTYDPAGNITTLTDSAKQTLYFRNVIVEPTQKFTHDSLYQLVQATGREHLGQPGGVPIPYSNSDASRFGAQPGDEKAMGTYREQYVYDATGNMSKLIHESSDVRQDHGNRSWAREFAYEVPSRIEHLKSANKLSSATVTGVVEEFKYDDHGNTTRFPHLGGAAGTENVSWDFVDRMKMLDLGGGGKAYYTYEGTDKRVRKVIEKGENLIEERLYLRGVEIFRKKNGTGDVVFERETVHIVDDRKKVAMVEIRNKDTAGRDRAPQRQIRYQLETHLGSGSVELDGEAKILTYEEYSPYGTTTYQGADPSLETPKRYRFAGKERDEESGFNYHGARYYVPWLARWCSVDPSGTDDGVNLYIYCHANPVVGLDATGKGDEHFKDMEALHNEVGEIYANKPPPAPLTPDPNPMSKKEYRRVANTENKRLRRNPPSETPLNLVDGRSTTRKPPPMKGSKIQSAHHGGALEAYESGISRKEFEKLPKERIETVSGKAAVMDPHTGEVDLVSKHRGVQENAINKPAMERSRRATGGKLTPEGFKESAEYSRWVGENVPLSEANADLLRNGMPPPTPGGPKPPVHAPVDKTITKEMVEEAEHTGADLFKKAAKKPGRAAKVAKALGKAGGHLAAAAPFVGAVAAHGSAMYSASQGDYVGAALDELGDIPVYGDALDLARAKMDIEQAVDELVGTQEMVERHGDMARAYVKQHGGGATAQKVVGWLVESASKESGVAKAMAAVDFARSLFN
jgi:RHS repeat-associated protein